MTIDYHRVKNWPFQDVVQSYTSRESMLYALSLGLGSDPLDEAGLHFVYEGADDSPRVLPTMAVVLGFPGFWMKDPASGIDWIRIVHGEHGLRMHHPLPSKGTVVGRTRVTSIVDKGVGKGAVVTAERTISDRDSGQLYASVRHVSFCRGDGGYSASGQPSDALPPSLAPAPEADPDKTFEHVTRPETALLYRLLADRNPLHADPAVAAAAGFAKPILHGLASFGVAAAAVLRCFCDQDPSRFESIDARFSAPVFPGETLRTEMWEEGAVIRFRCRVVERAIVAISHGRVVIRR